MLTPVQTCSTFLLELFPGLGKFLSMERFWEGTRVIINCFTINDAVLASFHDSTYEIRFNFLLPGLNSFETADEADMVVGSI